MEVDILIFYLGKRNVWGFSLLKAIAQDGMGPNDIHRSFAEISYDAINKKWSVMFLFYQIV